MPVFPACGRPWFLRTMSSKLIAWVQCVKAHPSIIVILFAFTCSATMLTSKIITEILENFWNFVCARITAMNLFQVDLDKSWNYLWYCYVRALVPPFPPPFQRAGGAVPLHMHPCSGIPEGLCVCAGLLDILKIDKNSTDLQCFIFQFRDFGALFGEAKPTKAPPWQRDWISLNMRYYSLETPKHH